MGSGSSFLILAWDRLWRSSYKMHAWTLKEQLAQHHRRMGEGGVHGHFCPERLTQMHLLSSDFNDIHPSSSKVVPVEEAVTWLCCFLRIAHYLTTSNLLRSIRSIVRLSRGNNLIAYNRIEALFPPSLLPRGIVWLNEAEEEDLKAIERLLRMLTDWTPFSSFPLLGDMISRRRKTPKRRFI